jgi:hypothetical protein
MLADPAYELLLKPTAGLWGRGAAAGTIASDHTGQLALCSDRY